MFVYIRVAVRFCTCTSPGNSNFSIIRKKQRKGASRVVEVGSSVKVQVRSEIIMHHRPDRRETKQKRSVV